ncbi:ABC transporter permease subunit [Actinophytocola sp. KF-1]
MRAVLTNVFLKTLRDQRRALVGWSIGLLVLVLLESALWPTVRDMGNLTEFVANYPEAMKELFKLDQFGTGTGFLNGELYSLMLPILFLVYGIGRGARSVAGEEEAGTLEVLLMTRVSPTSLVLHRAAALAAGMIALGAVLFVAVAVCSPLFGLDVPLGQAAAGSVAMVLLGVEFGWLALAVGAVTGRHVVATAVASAVAVAAYVLYAAGGLVAELEAWQGVSPFDQALTAGPLGGGLTWVFLWMPAAAVVFVAAAVPVFERRDITIR